MSTLILNYQFVDDTRDVEREFNDLTALSVWLHGQRESDFDWLTLYDNNVDDLSVDGWSDILQYIRENTGPVLQELPVKLDNLNWSHAESQHDLSKCGDACNCMKCRSADTDVNASNGMLKPDLIELTSIDEKIEFIYQEFAKNTGGMQDYTWEMLKIYFVNTHHISIDDQVWESNIYPVLYSIKHLATPKSSCIAFRASELGLPYIDASTMSQDEFEAIPEPVRNRSVIIGKPVDTVTFGELEDGAEFYIAMTWAYGSRNKLQKVMEDGEHNAVWCSATHIGELIPDGIRVVRA